MKKFGLKHTCEQLNCFGCGYEYGWDTHNRNNIPETIEIFGRQQLTIYPTNRLFKMLNLIEISPNLSKLCFFFYIDINQIKHFK